MAPRPPHAAPVDAPAGAPAPAASWAGDTAEAPAHVDALLPADQLALFAPDKAASATPRKRRLPGPIAALLGSRTKAGPSAPVPPAATSSWPDSFFDVPPA